MSNSDGYSPGDWNAQCYRCGTKEKASRMEKQWQGFWVCHECWEPRQPQDFVRAIPDNPSVPWVQPVSWEYTGGPYCEPAWRAAIPSYAVPGCMIPSRRLDDGTFIPIE